MVKLVSAPLAVGAAELERPAPYKWPSVPPIEGPTPASRSCLRRASASVFAANRDFSRAARADLASESCFSSERTPSVSNACAVTWAARRRARSLPLAGRAAGCEP